jgi:hypothetical protein
MKHSIVITSIFRPTEAVRRFSRMAGYNLIVVGDRKTPADWECPGVDFLSVQRQMESGFRLSARLPYNHYCRKMVGYLHAIRSGADTIYDTDDDNVPYENWGFPGFEGEQPATMEKAGFVNIYTHYTRMHIWPRGLPLGLVNAPGTRIQANPLAPKSLRVGIWQGLADDDPDTDAVYRLTNNTPCRFEKNGSVVLANGTLCPFNSQNTAFAKATFPLLYLPVTVTFRFTDILRGLVAQPILWAHGLHLGFCEATVSQERNPHDYMQDFLQEIPMYTHSQRVVDIALARVSNTRSLTENLIHVYSGLCQEGIVQQEEMSALKAWVEDLENLHPNG